MKVEVTQAKPRVEQVTARDMAHGRTILYQPKNSDTIYLISRYYNHFWVQWSGGAAYYPLVDVPTIWVGVYVNSVITVEDPR